MSRLYVLIGIINFATIVYAFIDCLRTPQTRVRALPKLLWAVLILIFQIFGAVLWFVLGKERLNPRRVRPAGYSSVAPDDDPAFLRKLSEDKRRNERIQELEARLSELDDDPKNPKD